MKNNIDFIYEYSDLNLFFIRVKVLTGHYKGIIFEFGSSVLTQWVEKDKEKNKFNFDYIIYEIPENLKNYKLRGTSEFESFLAYLLVDIIDDRNKDTKSKEKLHEAASSDGMHSSKININSSWYPKELLIYKNKQQPKTVGLEKF